jgi:hypothetical protein
MYKLKRREFIKQAGIVGATLFLPGYLYAEDKAFSIEKQTLESHGNYGDRNLSLNFSLPVDVMMDAGGRLINVKGKGFGAKGDGVTDDTHALVKAYDYVLQEMDKYEWNGSGSLSPLEYVIYLPIGTYLVSDSIVYSTSWREFESRISQNKNSNGRKLFEKLVRIRFIGENRDKTIIKLKNKAKGFSGDTYKPVLSFGKSDFNNCVAYNSVRNCTLNIGSGNESAIALDFCGANNTSLSNLLIKSEDEKGKIGINFSISPSMGYHHDITIEGFEVGIKMTPYHMTHNSFEYLTLKNQTISGIQLDECSTSIRKLLSVNKVPALEITYETAQAVVIDSLLISPGKSGNAIKADTGSIFLRNVNREGYASFGLPIPESGNFINEYINKTVLSLKENQIKKSLDLHIEELPSYNPPSRELWVSLDSYGAVGDGKKDDTLAVQKALNSGAEVIYLIKAQYKITTVTVPSTVRQIYGFYGSIDGNMIIDKGEQSLFIDDFGQNSGLNILHKHPRTLILNTLRVSYASLHKDQAAKVFINNCNNIGKNDRTFLDGNFWVRFMNTEYKVAPNFTCNGATMWVMGYKVEGRMTNFEVLHQGKLEVLGGMCNEHGQNFSDEIPILRNVDSSLCYIGLTNGPNKFEVIVEETLNGNKKLLKADDCPKRGRDPRGWKNDVVIPMYVSY